MNRGKAQNMKKHSIYTAVIPVAGLGTRFLPATKAQPKEMLPLVDKPIIQYVVEEAVAAGIKQVIFVTSIGKRAIEDHFDRNFELEYRLEQQKRAKELEIVSSIGRLAKFAFVRQAKQRGDGDAVLTALPFVRDRAFAVLFGDDIIESKTPGIKQLIEVFEEYQAPVIGVGRIPKKEVSKYGVIDGKKKKDRVYQLKSVVEKPTAEKAPSNLCIIGRYVVTPELVLTLTKQKDDVARGKEIRLADAFTTELEKGKDIYACEIQGTWHECGNKLGLLRAAISYGLKHPEIKQGLASYIKSIR